MKPAVLCLLLLSACELEAARNYRIYELTWSCLSSEGCERMEQVALLDRARIIDDSVFIEFLSSRDEVRWGAGQIVPSDELPEDCFWLYGLALFAYELEPSRYCRTSDGFEVELSIPNREPATQSQWFVEAREID